MRILLIRPNSLTQTLSPPTGLLYLSSSVKQVVDAHVDIIDARIERIDGEALKRRMSRFTPDIVGITAIVNEIASTIEAAGFARALWPKVPIALGGAWASSDPATALKKTGADLVVKGEGEITFRELALKVEAGEKFDRLPGTHFRSGDEIIDNGPRSPVMNLDTLPFPDFDAVNLENYLTNWRNGQNRLQRTTRIMPIFTSRGCPFNCIFCHNLYGKSFRPRSADHVVAEIELLAKRYGVREIEVSDDIFNFDLDRAKSIIRKIIERDLGVGLSFPNGVRADRADEELIDLLREAGCSRICYAVESASERIQKIIGKGIDLKKTFRMIEYTAKKGINVGGFFILGFPGETREDMEETVRFAVDSSLNTASFNYLSPFPGTRLVREYPQALVDSFRDYTDIASNISAVGDEELSDIRKRAYRRFYIDPKRIYENAKSSPKNYLLVKNVWALVKLFVMDRVNY